MGEKLFAAQLTTTQCTMRPYFMSRSSLNRRRFLKQSGVASLRIGLMNVLGGTSSTQTPVQVPEHPLGPLSPVDRFNYAVGTQTIGASYQFTDKPRLLETAEAIRDMGSSVIKFNLKAAQPRDAQLEKRHSLREVAAEDPVVKAIFNLPFAYYLLWAYPL